MEDFEGIELPAVNRSLVTVRVKQPYVDWANTLADRSDEKAKLHPITLDDVNEDATAYLVPEIFDPEEWDAYLETRWPILFEELLSWWSLDPELWPKRRNRKMLDEWFEITLHSLVKDLPNRDPIGYEE